MAKTQLVIVAVLMAVSAILACRPDWDNQCDKNEECCSKYCHRDDPSWATGVCKPNNNPTKKTTTKKPGPTKKPSPASVSEEEFMRAVESCGFGRPGSDKYKGFVNGFKAGRISSKQEAAMALAQFMHESGGLVHKREWKCRADGPTPECRDEYRTPDCDVSGQTYYGRGYIQLTWCNNYRSASQDLLGNDELRRDPDRVARDEDMAWKAAYWFWGKNVHDEATTGKFGLTTKKINGQQEECQGTGKNADKSKKRFEYYTKIFRAFNLKGTPDESGCNY